MTGWSGSFADMTIPWPTTSDVRIFDLAVRLEPGMPKHPYHPPYSFVLAKKHGDGMYPGGISSAMEMITMGAHVGTHVDALGHVGLEGMVHGDRPILEHQSSTLGIEHGSTEECPPLIGRGHLIDAVELFGRDLTPADGIGVAELEKWFADHEEPGPGSVVLVRTGWMRYWADNDRYLGLQTGLPGMKREGAEWLSSRGIVATGSDTVNYEHKPDVTKAALSVHQHNLVEQGIYILECLDLETLAEHRVHDFTFLALPLRIGGGTGSPLRPVAIAPRPAEDS